jgi:hypothetical protein
MRVRHARATAQLKVRERRLSRERVADRSITCCMIRAVRNVKRSSTTLARAIREVQTVLRRIFLVVR